MHKEFVYVIRADRYYKIGRTVNLSHRIAQLRTQFPFPCKLFKVINTDDAVAIEKELHEQFAKSRVNGEWFELPALDAFWLLMWNPDYPNGYVQGNEAEWAELFSEMTDAWLDYREYNRRQLLEMDKRTWQVADS